MSVTELEVLAERIETIARDAVVFNTNRETLIYLMRELAQDLQDEADQLAYGIQRELSDERHVSAR